MKNAVISTIKGTPIHMRIVSLNILLFNVFSPSTEPVNAILTLFNLMIIFPKKRKKQIWKQEY